MRRPLGCGSVDFIAGRANRAGQTEETVEKLIYALWKPEAVAPDAFYAGLRNALTAELLAIPGVRGLRLNLPDADVARAQPLRLITTAPAPDAIAQLWLDVGHGEFRAPVDAALRAHTDGIAAWLATESEVIANATHPPLPGARTPGWSQVCFLQQPARLTSAQWLDIWQGSHTRIAIETQANFEYLQNLLVRQVLGDALPYTAMVEECFPADAMDHPDVFFDAVNDPERLQRHQTAMTESCVRFIDFDKIDVIPTSQYVMRQRVS